ncbi:MAG: hypothetical protein QOJ98_2001 [Acidobacteriota bacterium]|jgi:membrane-associated phospholipid phosphatase|nr:hypothetical protein [Acidobacteriota bacterium]
MLESSTRQAQSIAGAPMHALEIVFGFPVSKFLAGAVILLAGIALYPFARYRYAAWVLALVGLSQLTTRLVAGVLKNVFLRPRPSEALASGQGSFFTDGSSFPSGHAAHFWPFFFAALIAFPRWRIPLFVLALFVSLARVAVNDHYVGDVASSAAIAAIVTYGYARALGPRLAGAMQYSDPS